MKLNDIAEFVTDKISSSSISLDRYVTTDSLLQNRRGREIAQNLPPVPCALTHYKQGDVLVANIRPYLKKVWYADSEGGCSSDVLAFRAKNGHCPSFLYTVLMQDAFFDYAMSGAKGSKMPRGDKDQIMRYELPTFTPTEEENIGNMMVDIMSKINVNRQINDNLEAMAKQLYDYWFVQFDFPNEEGKPYKSSGGTMAWNEKLKREIPQGWNVVNVSDIANVRRGQIITSKETSQGNIKVVAAAVTYSYLNGESNRPKNTITVSGSGANAGFINFWREPIFASDCTTVNCNTDIDTILCLYGLSLFQERLYSLAIGAAQPHVYPAHVASIPILAIPQNLKEKVSDFFCKSNDVIAKNLAEIENLIKQRDELLPLLMNGQATVNYHLSAC